MKIRLVVPTPEARLKLRRLARIALWTAAGGCLVLGVFAVSFYLAMRVEMRSTEVTVPDLRGVDLDEAHRMVEPVELVLQVDNQRHDPAVPSGHVLDQVPPPGASVRRGRKVKLIVSLGGEVLEVPDLVTHAARAVEIELRQEGFIPGDEARVYRTEAETGVVIAQVPPAGSPAVPNTRVHRLVSDGPRTATWVMPDLTRLSREEAERWIRTSGFRRGAVRRVRMSGHVSDSVVGQLPLAGYPVRSRDVIELTVAR